jgi:bifunctional DNase/RNase
MDICDLRPLHVAGVDQATEQQRPLLRLGDDLGRPLHIPIGACEALAIQLGINHTIVGRPLTHDLFLGLAERLQGAVVRVIIDDCSGGTYFARLIMDTPDGEVSLDSRPSDAVAIALRCGAELFASEAVMLGEEST